MGAPSRRPRSYAARAIEEALGAVAAPAVCDAILAAALSRSGAVATPDGDALVSFVRGPLYGAVSDRLGDDVADEVLVMLQPVILQIARRPSARPNARPTVRPEPAVIPVVRPDLDAEESSGIVVVRHGKTVRAGDFLPVILTISSNAEWMRGLAEALVGRAVARPISELFEMVEALEDHRGDTPVVLFDCGSPPFHLESVATFASELPPGSWLALLGPRAADERVARDFAGTTLTIARLRAGEPIATIGARCLALIA